MGTVEVALPKPRQALRRAVLLSDMPAWQVAYLAGLSATQMSHIVRGRREVRPDEAERLAAVLDSEVGSLFPELEED